MPVACLSIQEDRRTEKACGGAGDWFLGIATVMLGDRAVAMFFLCAKGALEGKQMEDMRSAISVHL